MDSGIEYLFACGDNGSGSDFVATRIALNGATPPDYSSTRTVKIA